MPQRTTTLAVVSLLKDGADYDNRNNPSVQPYIDTASVVVNRVVACALDKGIPLGDDEAELVERWLAAHNYKCVDQAYASKSTAGASASFQGQTGKGIDGTKYGQMALRIDYSGCLTQIDNRQVAGGFWLGNAPEVPTGGGPTGL